MVSRLKGEVVTSAIDGAGVSFFVVNPTDVIQKRHYAGHFYEEEELQIIAKYFRTGMVYVDVGANIGNHVLYVQKYLSPSLIIAIEPNPVAREILRINCALNAISVLAGAELLTAAKASAAASRVPCSAIHLLETGLSDAVERMSVNTPVNNLGGTSLLSDAAGGISVIRGDELLQQVHVQFLKIDVEGMELRVLAGLSKTIRKCRPTIFIEVDNANADAFFAWVLENNYLVVERYKRYPVNENFLIIPGAQSKRGGDASGSIFRKALSAFFGK